MGEDCVTKRPIRRRAHEEQPSYWPAVRKITANNGANIKKPLKTNTFELLCSLSCNINNH